MSYEAWRISYQSSEAAARAAYEEMARLASVIRSAMTDIDRASQCANGSVAQLRNYETARRILALAEKGD